MQHDQPAFPTDYALFIVVAEATARRRLSVAYRLRSGAVPVLAAIGAVFSQGNAIRPANLHAAGLMSASLLRDYVRELCQAGLLERYTRRGTRYLRLTPAGANCLAIYQRHLRGATRQYFEHTRIS
jgi:predicted transcriptional regulator